MVKCQSTSQWDSKGVAHRLTVYVVVIVTLKNGFDVSCISTKSEDYKFKTDINNFIDPYDDIMPPSRWTSIKANQSFSQLSFIIS